MSRLDDNLINIGISRANFHRMNMIPGGLTHNEMIGHFLDLFDRERGFSPERMPPTPVDDCWGGNYGGILIEVKTDTALKLLELGHHMEEYDSVIQRLIKNAGDFRFVHRTLFKPQLPGSAHIPPMEDEPLDIPLPPLD